MTGIEMSPSDKGDGLATCEGGRPADPGLCDLELPTEGGRVGFNGKAEMGLGTALTGLLLPSNAPNKLSKSFCFMGTKGNEL